MVFAGLSAHFMRLNKIVAIVFSNVSIPPMIPFILYGSMVAGAWMLNIDNIFSIDNVSLQSVGQSLCQYLIGSVALATISGIAVFAIALVVMVLCKRRSRDE